MSRCWLVVTSLFVYAISGGAEVATWQIDPAHSSAQFTVRHMMISNVRGEFSKMTGTVQYDPADLSKTSVAITIEASSLNSRLEPRDKDLKSANYLDVEKYPTLTLKSKRIEPAGTGKLKLMGDLTIHGVTREVTFDVDGPTQSIKDDRGNHHMGASATTKINRKDFGITRNRVLEGGGVLVGEEVAITIDVELVKHTSADAN